MMLHKFSKGAKEDLLALHNEHTYADVLSYIKNGSPCDHKLGNIRYNNIVVNRNNREIVGVTLFHLNRYARYLRFIVTCVLIHRQLKWETRVVFVMGQDVKIVKKV